MTKKLPHAAVNQPERAGYSLLELMIALSLLSALMLAGWSLLDTYSRVQERGWKSASRSQTVQSTRRLLQDDLLRTVPMESSATTTQSAAVQPTTVRPFQSALRSSDFGLVGDSTGFKVAVYPSLEPLPILEKFLSQDGARPQNDIHTRSRTIADSPPLDGSRELTAQRSSWSMSWDWVDEPIQVEYRLVALSAELSEQSVDQEFRLVRRQLRRSNRAAGTEIIPNSREANRELSLSDLYRQGDVLSDLRQDTSQLGEIVGLVKADFAYSDGQHWRASWNSQSLGRLPSAIALTFDLPALAQSGRSVDAANASDPPTRQIASRQESESPATVDGQLPDREIRIVVLMDGAAGRESSMQDGQGASGSSSRKGAQR